MPKADRRDSTVLQAVLDVSKQVSNLQIDLTKNTTKTEAIEQHLVKLNGSVAKHETAISLNEKAVALLTQTLTNLTSATDANTAKKSDWLDWLLKGVVVIALLLFYKLLTETGIVQQFLN